MIYKKFLRIYACVTYINISGDISIFAMDFLPNDVLTRIMDKASPWTAYCMALCNKHLLQHYQSGRCPHNVQDCSGKCESISKILQKLDETARQNLEIDDFDIEEERAEQEWLATDDVAGKSTPLGDFWIAGMNIHSISGYDFTFICENSDGRHSDRRLLLIDDYFKIKKGKKYKSFVIPGDESLPRFKACFDRKLYTPCTMKEGPCFCPVEKQMVAYSICGYYDAYHLELSTTKSRGYEANNFDIRAVENSRSFGLKLVLRDALEYSS